MLTRYGLHGLRCAALAIAMLCSALAAAQSTPLKVRIGIGNAVEEQLWLLIARPDVTPNQGKAYAVDYARFPGADKRFQAFEAGALDIATASANSAIFAAAEGVEFKIIASLSRESTRGFYTKFLVRNDSPIRTVKDLKGRTIGINGFSGSGHLWTRAVLEKNGLSEKDVTLVPMSFPAQGEALKAGKVDVGMFPQPFAQMVEKQGGVRLIYSSKDAAPYEEELMLLIAKQGFLKKNGAAVKAFLADVVAATRYYTQKPQESRKALIDGKMVRVAPEVYLDMPDYYRDPAAHVDLAALERMQDLQVKAGFQTKRADLKARVDLSYLPN